ncbi:hypothetical protein J4212_01360 [Candidatus Woesearchaeota archaeon]|nr:hypothetical protein [Candidatus Woesearchaeota archaeon]
MADFKILGQPIAIHSGSTMPLARVPTTANNRILSEHYDGTLHLFCARSKHGFKNYSEVGHSIYTSEYAGHGRLDKYSVVHVPTISGNQKIFKTSNTSFGVPIGDGAIVAHWEEADREFLGWRDANTHGFQSYVPVASEVGYLEGRERRAGQAHPTETRLNLYVTDKFVHVPLNKVGQYMSYNYNLKQMARELMYDETGFLSGAALGYIKHLNEHGMDNPREIIATMAMNMPGKLAAAITKGDYAILAANKNLYRMSRRKIAGYVREPSDKDVKEAYKSVILHEFEHVFDRSRSASWAKEMYVGENLSKFFDELAEQTLDSKLAEVYRAIARESRDYAEFYRSHHNSSSRGGHSHDSLEAKVAVYMAKGYSMGMSHSQAKAYATKKAREEISRENADKEMDRNLEDMLDEAEGESTRRHDKSENKGYKGGEHADYDSEKAEGEYRGDMEYDEHSEAPSEDSSGGEAAEAATSEAPAEG